MRRGLAAAGAAAVLCAVATACGPAPGGDPARTAGGERSGVEAGAGRPVYLGTATVDPATGHLAAEWTIRFVTDAATVETVTLLLSDRLTVTALDGAGVSQYRERPAEGGRGRTEIDVVWAGPASPGDTRELRIAYEGVLFREAESEAINSITSGWIELGLDAGWHPVFASFDQLLVGDLRLSIPGEWTVAASGEVDRDGEIHVVRNRIPQVDFAFAAAPDMRLVGGEVVQVFHQDAPESVVLTVSETASACRSWLTERFGEMPTIRIVLAPRSDESYARKNYLVLSRVTDLPAPALSRFLCHELAHYWSSAPSPLSPDYWMTESFAELVAARYVREAHGDGDYAEILEQWRSRSEGLPAVWTEESTTRPGMMISYRKGPFVLTRLAERIGDEAFSELLRRYMTEPTATTGLLLERLDSVAGPEAADWFRRELGKAS